MEENKELEQALRRIAEKSAALVEGRIDDTMELTGTALKDIYDGVHILGHVVATLERLNRA